LINQLLGKVFGTKNERVVKSLTPRVQAINALEPQMQKVSDAELRAKTDEFRQRIQERLSRVTRNPQAEAADPEADEIQGEPAKVLRRARLAVAGFHLVNTERCSVNYPVRVESRDRRRNE